MLHAEGCDTGPSSLGGGAVNNESHLKSLIQFNTQFVKFEV